MITLDYTTDLWNDLMDNFEMYYQTGWTVCGAQDPAIIFPNEHFYKKYPELLGCPVVRVIDKYLNEWNSATLLEFSDKDMTDEEYAEYEKLMDEEEGVS